jgi:hypothetical protein
MQYYHPDFFQELVLGLGLDWCMFVQNGKTLGQFFELLYTKAKECITFEMGIKDSDAELTILTKGNLILQGRRTEPYSRSFRLIRCLSYAGIILQIHLSLACPHSVHQHDLHSVH